MAGIVEEPLTTPPLVLVERFLDSVCKSRSVLDRLSSLPDFIFSRELTSNSYYLLVRELYIAMLKLYATGQHYVCLDVCRKIVEVLVRKELSISLDEDLWAIRKKLNSLQWPPTKKEEALDIYNIGNEAIHFQREKLWKRASQHSHFRKEEVREKLSRTFPEERVEDIARAVQGVSGIDKLVIETMDKTIELANFVFSRK
ncbi:MAG: hypothetical protein D6769_01175 [Methanobacteriota archaeon]|nr:MAG: hypothetical protein D6769_01175 [Euryarchaeota archaeon]